MFGYTKMSSSGSPVVGELQLQSGVIRSLDGDDVGAEVRAEQEAEGLDDVGSLGLPTRETQLCELFIWLQHHKVWAKHHPGRLLLVVVDLDRCIVGHTEADDFGLVALEPSTRASCVMCSVGVSVRTCVRGDGGGGRREGGGVEGVQGWRGEVGCDGKRCMEGVMGRDVSVLDRATSAGLNMNVYRQTKMCGSHIDHCDQRWGLWRRRVAPPQLVGAPSPRAPHHVSACTLHHTQHAPEGTTS